MQTTRITLWEAMADQFLDTEVRHHLPIVALRAVELGLTTAEAEHVWLNEVTPAVGFNLYDVAGEWAGWNRDWLVERIEHKRRPPGPTSMALGWLLRVRHADGLWEAIRRFMVVLEQAPPDARGPLAGRLHSIARHCVDFCPADYTKLDTTERAALRRLWPDPFTDAMQPSLVTGEWEDARRRIDAALGP